MYTTHGHQIPGTPVDPNTPAKEVRCGGVRICSVCFEQTKQAEEVVALALGNLAFSEDSGLVSHAKKELSLLGEDPDVVRGYIRVIQAFADMGHSGGSAMIAIPTITALLNHENLSPLTNDPNEWVFHDKSVAGGTGIWQSTRNPEAFSSDGGKSYWLLSECELDHSRGPSHTSVNYLEDPRD